MKSSLWFIPLVGLAVVGNFTRAQAADPTNTGILERLDRLEEENRELRATNERLESLFQQAVTPLPPREDVARLPSANHHYASYGDSGDGSADQQDPGAAILQLGAGMEQLQSGMEQLGAGVKELGAGVKELGKNLTVTTANKEHGSKIALFGSLTGEMIFAEKRPIIPSAITQIAPDFGNESQTADLHAKSSYLGAAVIGPQVGCFQTGGLALAYFYG